MTKATPSFPDWPVAAIGGLLLGTVLSLFYLLLLYVWVMGKVRR